MAEQQSNSGRPTDPVGRFLYVLTYWLALLGGLVLCAMALVTTVSVSGRYFFNSPITGDFELIGMGTGIAVFAFLPFCQLMRENVIVDFFLSHTSKRFQSFFDFLGNLIYGLIITLMTWRTPIGMRKASRTSRTANPIPTISSPVISPSPQSCRPRRVSVKLRTVV